MTECNTDVLSFGRLGRRDVTADFQGGRLTSDAGVLLLREVDRRIGLLDAIDDCIPDPRDPRYVTHAQRSLLAQRIFALALGYEDLSCKRGQEPFCQNGKAAGNNDGSGA